MSVLQIMTLEMARYNKWQNGELYRYCDVLTDAERQEDRGFFFGSLHRTLNHIIHVDRVLMAFLETGVPPQTFNPDTVPFAEYAALQAARRALDESLIERFDAAPEAWFEEAFEFFSDRLGRIRKVPRAFYVQQMFNHQTHHRAQATAMLHQLGIAYGSTDLPDNPLSQF